MPSHQPSFLWEVQGERYPWNSQHGGVCGVQEEKNRAMPWIFWQPESEVDPEERVEVFQLLSLDFEFNVQVLSIVFTTSGSCLPTVFQSPAPSCPPQVLALSFLLSSALPLHFWVAFELPHNCCTLRSHLTWGFGSQRANCSTGICSIENGKQFVKRCSGEK